MNDHAFAIEDRIHNMTLAQIETFRQPGPLTDSQLREFRKQTQALLALYKELEVMKENAFLTQFK
jgi:hypothetical protein